jgi:hypothetical protein
VPIYADDPMAEAVVQASDIRTITWTLTPKPYVLNPRPYTLHPKNKLLAEKSLPQCIYYIRSLIIIIIIYYIII